MKFLSKFWCEQLGTWQIRHGFDLLPGYNITAGCWEQLPPMLERLVSPLGGLTRGRFCLNYQEIVYDIFFKYQLSNFD
jgi:hypothetical protein